MSDRIIPPKYETNSQHSAEEIAEAMKKFEENGGLIRKLPEERISSRRLAIPTDPKNSWAYEGVGVNGE